tara:strand:- start:713 stop:1828 length:1116 start_codon:yes stop_codon:yes gene_type:complete
MADRDRIKSRYHGLDILRTLSFQAIVTHHFAYFAWYTIDIKVSKYLSLIYGWELYARSLAFSGFTICFLTCFLMGFSRGEKLRTNKIIYFLGVGWLTFMAIWAINEDYFEFDIGWDIYPLLALGLLAARGLERIGFFAIKVATFLSLLLLVVPINPIYYVKEKPSALEMIIGPFGCSRTYEMEEWPILPWIGLVIGGYGAGVILANKLKSRSTFNMSRWELAIWATALFALSPYLGSFFNIPLGQRFGCEAYRQPPLFFWAHFIWPIFIIRLSLDSRINCWLHSSRAIRWLSKRKINTHFWLAYFCAYSLLVSITILGDFFEVLGAHFPYKSQAWIATIAITGCLPCVELMLYGFTKLKQRFTDHLQDSSK